MNKSNNAVACAAISHGAAVKAAQAAVTKATELGLKICVAVVDSSAVLMTFVRMNGAFQISNELSQKKARCSAGIGVAPDVVDQILSAEAPRVREGLMSSPDFIQIHGGLPIYEGGVLLGAIGISGGTEAQDVICARSGVDALDLLE